MSRALYCLRHRTHPKCSRSRLKKISYLIRKLLPSFLYRKNDPSALFGSSPGRLDFGQRHGVDGDVEAAGGGQGKELGDRREDHCPSPRNRSRCPNSFRSMLRRVAPGRVIVRPALSPTSTSACGAWPGTKALGQGFKKQFGRPAPEVVDDHVDPFAASAAKASRTASSGWPRAMTPSTSSPAMASTLRPDADDALGAQLPRHLHGQLAGDAGCTHDQHRFASGKIAPAPCSETHADIPGLAIAAACASSIPSGNGTYIDRRTTVRSAIEPNGERAAQNRRGVRLRACLRHPRRERRHCAVAGVVCSARPSLDNRVQSSGADVDDGFAFSGDGIGKILIFWWLAQLIDDCCSQGDDPP